MGCTHSTHGHLRKRKALHNRPVQNPSTNPNRALSVEEWKRLLGPVKELEESASTNTLESIGKNPNDRALKLEKVDEAGYKKIYNYRQLSSVPLLSQTRTFLNSLL